MTPRTNAKVIADSVSLDGIRLTTLEVTLHRFVLAEFNTHRVFSRNSASSRAIPLRKTIERVLDDPAVPLVFPAEKPGMQGGEPLDTNAAADALDIWHTASLDAIRHARRMQDLGVHKSVVNRILEPFLWHTIIVTSTEWDNFFAQRCSPLAQPELRAAADLMRAALNTSTPKRVDFGEWHLPFIHEDDLTDCRRAGIDPCHVSVARCARVSYLTHDGVRDVREDEALYQRLVTAEPPHWSPLEHVATPIKVPQAHLMPGNLYGWAQLRHLNDATGEGVLEVLQGVLDEVLGG